MIPSDMKTPQQEINDTFDDFVAKVFPTVVKGSPEHLDLYRTFIAGAFTMVELMSRPHESVAQAEAHVAALMWIIDALMKAVDEERVRSGN